MIRHQQGSASPSPTSRSHTFRRGPVAGMVGAGMLATMLALAGCQSSGSNGGGGTLTARLLPAEKTIEKALRRASKPDNGFIVFGDQKIAPATSELAFSGVPRAGSMIEMANVGRVPSSGMEDYFARIVTRLLDQWQGPLPSLGFFLVPEASFGASATGSGDIFVNIGTFEYVKSEDELAALLAHELSHVLLNHSVREARAKQTLDVINRAAGFAIMGLYASNAKASRQGNTTTIYVADEERLDQQYKQASLYWMAARTISDDILNSLWSRLQEDEADQLGVDLLQRAGYDIEAMLQILDYQSQSNGKQQILRSQLSPILAKAGALEAVAGLIGGDQQTAQKGLFKLGAAVVTEVATNVGRKVLHQHQSPEKRSELVRAYIEKHYFDVDPPVRDDESFAKVTNGKTFTAIRGNYGYMFEANRQFVAAHKEDNSAKMAQARELLNRGLQGPTRHDPFGVMLAYQMEEQSNNGRRSLEILKTARNIEYAPLQYHQALAQKYTDRGEILQAERAIDRGETYVKNRDLLFPSRIVTAMMANDEERLARYRAECASSRYEEMREACVKAQETRNGIIQAPEGRKQAGVFAILNEITSPVPAGTPQPVAQPTAQATADSTNAPTSSSPAP